MVVTRFAPSPTGQLHIGGLRTALYCYLYARKRGGKFYLRIEDTDSSRSSDKFVKSIFEAFEWVGLDYDELEKYGGQDHGGSVLYQSKMGHVYEKYAKILLEEGKAYYCYLSKEELDENRANARMGGSDRHEFIRKYRDFKGEPPAGVKPCIRIKCPLEGYIEFNDGVKGPMKISASEVEDFVIVRSDGSPTYNFVVAIDDAMMGVTDVIRGDDHLSNTPKQIVVYKSLGFNTPNFFHAPMICSEYGKKLSKRDGALGVLEYKERGYLGKALLNFLFRLGFSDGNKEIFSLDEMLQCFDPYKINKKPSVFSEHKLAWLNVEHLKSKMDVDSELMRKLNQPNSEYARRAEYAIYSVKSSDSSSVDRAGEFFVFHHWIRGLFTLTFTLPFDIMYNLLLELKAEASAFIILLADLGKVSEESVSSNNLSDEYSSVSSSFSSYVLSAVSRPFYSRFYPLKFIHGSYRAKSSPEYYKSLSDAKEAFEKALCSVKEKFRASLLGTVSLASFRENRSGKIEGNPKEDLRSILDLISSNLDHLTNSFHHKLETELGEEVVRFRENFKGILSCYAHLFFGSIDRISTSLTGKFNNLFSSSHIEKNAGTPDCVMELDKDRLLGFKDTFYSEIKELSDKVDREISRFRRDIFIDFFDLVKKMKVRVESLASLPSASLETFRGIINSLDSTGSLIEDKLYLRLLLSLIIKQPIPRLNDADKAFFADVFPAKALLSKQSVVNMLSDTFLELEFLSDKVLDATSHNGQASFTPRVDLLMEEIKKRLVDTNSLKSHATDVLTPPLSYAELKEQANPLHHATVNYNLDMLKKLNSKAIETLYFFCEFLVGESPSEFSFDFANVKEAKDCLANFKEFLSSERVVASEALCKPNEFMPILRLALLGKMGGIDLASCIFIIGKRQILYRVCMLLGFLKVKEFTQEPPSLRELS